MQARIAVNPNIHFGKPCVAGTRIPVESVLELVSEGLSFEEIIQDYYPDLQVEDIRACIRYVIDVMAAEDIHMNGFSRPGGGVSLPGGAGLLAAGRVAVAGAAAPGGGRAA